MQSKNQNDGVQLSTRYEQYVFAKRHSRGTSRPEVFPFGGTDKEVANARRLHSGNERRFSQGKNGQEEIKHTGDTYNKSRGDGSLYERGTPTINQLNSPTHSNDRVYGEDGISPTLNTMQGGNRQPFVAAMRGRNPENSSDRTVGAPTEQRLEVNINGTSNTLTSVGKDNLVLEEMKIRRLTPTECERLQGFPDKHTYLGSTIVFDENGNKKWKDEFISDSQRYKMCGNAVTVNVIRDIMEKLL